MNIIGMILIYAFVELLVNLSPSLTAKKNEFFQSSAQKLKDLFN
jgi:hypothetical protein